VAQPAIKTSFASGEWAPKLQSRVDVQKYGAGAALLRNFYVDYSGGGASTRQGTKFIAQCGANGARLIPFQPSTTLSYVLEFGQNYIRFYSNGAQVQAGGGGPYQITTPYNIQDLFPNPATGNPGLKFVQDVTSLIICHPSYAPAILTINSANSWTYTTIAFGPTIAAPTGLNNPSNTLPGGGEWYYSYLVTAVDANGQESGPSIPIIITELMYIGTTPGSINIAWNAVNGAVSYNVYKASPTFDQNQFPTGTTYGFIGNVTGTAFTENYPGIGADFSQTPPILQNPFLGASVTALNLTGNATYTAVPPVVIGAPSVGYQATGYASAQVDTYSINGGSIAGSANPIGAIIYCGVGGVSFEIVTVTHISGGWEITGTQLVNAGSVTSGSLPATLFGTSVSQGFTFGPGNVPNWSVTWDIGSLILVQGGFGYTSDPPVTISGGATATSTIGTQSGGNPSVPAFFQERLALAAQPLSIQTYNLSQPASFFNFNVSNPSEDDDAITGTIISEELNDIRSLIPVPTGLIALTGKGAWLINGGGGLSVNNPITPSNQTAAPQAFNGANDLKPIKVNLDVLYGTNKGNYVRDLTYNIYAAIYTGSDISVMSNHLFFGYYMLDWAWSEEPFKTLWCVRNDGVLLSLGYVKEQDLTAWAHHDTNGQFLSVCSVIENVNGNIVDAVYVIVQRLIGGSFVQYVERMADRYFSYGKEDAWSVDCALQTAPQASPTSTLTITGNASAVGNSVTLSDSVGTPFTSGMVGWVVRAMGGIYTISAYTSTEEVTATVTRVPTFINEYTGSAFPVTTGYAIWEPVTTVSGLTQLEGQSVVGVADGTAIGPLTVSGGGGVTLPGAASKVTLGLAFLPQLKTLPLDLGEPTVQGKRKKITGVTLRVADTLGLQIGTTFANAVTMKDFTLGNIGSASNALVTDLVDGDGRTIIDQDWQEAGSYCIQQNLPYPATVLGAMPEVVVGDTK
jgi:hypothetical protein